MTTTTTASSSKKAFDFKRDSIYVVDPLEICIIGGAILPEDERGPLDTAHKAGQHDLYDSRIEDALDPAFVASIDAFGVLEPGLITKDDALDLAVAVDMRQRLRAARKVNVARRASGQVPMKIQVKKVVQKGAALMGVMITANEARKDDSVMVKIAKLKAYVARGVTPEDAAIAFALNPTYVKQLLTFDERASVSVKAAAASGRLSVSAACEIARLDGSEAQDAALTEVLTSAPTSPAGGRKATVRAAVAAVTKVKDAGATVGGKPATTKPAAGGAKPAAPATQGGLVPTRRELNGLLRELGVRTEVENEAAVFLDDARAGNAKPTIKGTALDLSHVEGSWLIGVKAGIELALGKCEDKELLKLLAKAAQS